MRLLITFLAWVLALQPGPFHRRGALDVGPGSGEILVADVNRDGHPDVITKHLLQKRITISLGNGLGGFRRGPGSLELPYEPGALTAGDANGDGIVDLAVASRRDGAELVAMFPGDGRGGFVKTADHRVHAAMPYYKPVVQFVDVDEDGKPDLVTANGRRNAIHWLKGDGRGGFGPPSAIDLEAGGDGYSFALADVDGDGHLDLVSAMSSGFQSSTGTLTVSLGNGRGTFAKTSSQPVEGPRIEAAADIDGDGRPDIVLSHPSPKLTVLTNQGRGVFAAGETLALPIQSHAVATGDVNGDGRVDLAAATDTSVTVFTNDGRRLVQAAGSPFAAGPGAFVVTMGDLNGDGKKDLAASSFGGMQLTLLFGR